jgi:hypothetical protein
LRQEASALILNAFSNHTLPPSACASGRESHAYKLHASIHPWYLETGNLQALIDFLDCFISWTTDGGTESLTADAQDLDLRQMFPHWQDFHKHSSGACGGVGDDDGEDIDLAGMNTGGVDGGSVAG